MYATRPEVPTIPSTIHDEFQKLVGEWADKALPTYGYLAMVEHLRREALEAFIVGINIHVTMNPDITLRDDGVVDYAEPGTEPIHMDGPTERQKERLAEELADMVLIALHLAHRMDISLYEACRRKMEVNQRRTWGPPDENGVQHHAE